MLTLNSCRVGAWILVAVALIATPGCNNGPRMVPVAGQVLIDGEPVKGGFIRFVPNDARPAYGELDKQGRFSLTTVVDNDGCVVGVHQIEVVAKEFPTETSTKWLVPKKYADLETSELQAEITEPKSDFLLNLTWDGGQPIIEQSEAQGDVVP